MTTLIVKENGNEVIKSNIKFRILMNRGRLDMFVYETYSEVKARLNLLSRIFKNSSFDILVIE